MQKIIRLSPEVIGQIAAGEVVERPAAAIKELIENALDAGATAVTVDIREGGLTCFSVTDNGSGIPASELRMAFERHATSKIRDTKDLWQVATLGFRGEALASIAAVAHVRLTTRTADAETGMQVQNDGGQITSISEAASPLGTSVVVKDLFYNAPVRRKFLKKPAYETAGVTELMARLILSRPDISFRYMADGKNVYFSPGDGQLKNALLSIYGLDVLRMLTQVKGVSGGVIVEGFVGVGDVSRSNRSQEYFFINKRVMKSALLSNAVETACRQRVMIGRFPMCALHLTMPYEQTDVNVHPNKWEIRFQNEAAVRDAVEQAVRTALEESQQDDMLKPRLFADPLKTAALQPAPEVRIQPAVNAAPAVVTVTPVKPAAPSAASPSAATPEVFRAPVTPMRSETTLKPAAEKTPVEPVEQQPRQAPSPKPAIPEQPQPAPEKKPDPAAEQQALPGTDTVKARLIGVAFGTYILFEYGDQLVFCDQHAAHERVLYERLMRETAQAPVSQTLLVPETLTINRTEYAAWLENRDLLQSLGYDTDQMGEDTLVLRGLPVILGQTEAVSCLRDSLDELAQFGRLDDYDKKLRVATMACKHAVKGGERVPDEELVWLMTEILSSRIPPTCPHGRPLMVTVTHTELDKRFRRIQQ